MGLVISHGAFEGSYAAFNRFRRHILRSIGGTFPPHGPAVAEAHRLSDEHWYWFIDANGHKPFDRTTHPGLYELFAHSDCDGDISPETCKLLADELESILPQIEQLEAVEPATGQIHARGGYTQMTINFISACRFAHYTRAPLEFL